MGLEKEGNGDRKFSIACILSKTAFALSKRDKCFMLTVSHRFSGDVPA